MPETPAEPWRIMKKENKISKEKILSAALRLMSEKGYEAVSMRELSADLGVTKPMLYYYFKDKDAIIKEAFSSKARELEELDLKISDGVEPEDIIYKVILAHYKIFAENAEAVNCAMKIMDSPKKSPLHKHAMELREKNRTKVRKVLLELCKKGKIKKENVEYAIHLISALLAYQMIEMKIQKENLNEKILKTLSAIVGAGIKHFRLLLLAFLIPLLAGSAAAEDLTARKAVDTGLEDLTAQKTVDTALGSLTVQKAVDTALANNTTVINAMETRRVYEQKIREYWGGVYPNLSLSASYTRNIEKQSLFFGAQKIKLGMDNAYTASLDLNQILWAGGKVDTGIKMARLYEKIAGESLKQARNTVKKAVKQMYYSVRLFSELSKIQKENLDLSRMHLNTIREQYKQGLQSDLAVMRQEVEVSNNEPALIKAENAYEQGLLQLKNLLGIEPETRINLTEDPDCSVQENYDFNELYAKALSERQDFKLAVFNKDLAEKQVKLEKAGHWPTISAFASKAFSGQSNSFFPDSSQRSWSLAAGARLSLPVFSGFSVNAKVSQAEHNLKIAEQNLKETRRMIKINLTGVLLDLKEAEKSLDSQKTSVATAKKALEAVETRFRNGLSSQLELNDSTLALNRAETLYIQGKHDLCYSKAQLDFELGK